MSDGLKKIIMGVVAVVLVIVAIYSVSGMFGEEDYVQTANTRTLKDSQTGDLFQFELTLDWDMNYPHKNPKTGTDTLYPIEWCYNRECGSKDGGTAVILNRWLGKDEPTYCPECGSLVRLRNPRPRNAKNEQGSGS